MKHVVYDNYHELSFNTAKQIAGIILHKPHALLCFPAGETSVGTFEELIKLKRDGKLSFRSCKIVGLDEWLDLGDMKNENCLSFLRNHFFDHIDYTQANLCFFDGESANPEHEITRTDNFIERFGPIDMILLGAGMNGHLGLNEPGTPFNLNSHIVDLDDVTMKVGQKYFSGEVKLKRGITLGINHIMNSRTAILQITGHRKADVVKRLLSAEISPGFPASALKSHPDSWLLLDREAAGVV